MGKRSRRRGAGEILFTSMNHDGTKNGFANEQLAQLADSLKIPVIASGGAGAKEHFVDVFTKGKADAGLAASIFHYNEIPVPVLKAIFREKGIAIR
jgi:imidazole glycerol-phosphate synthase subunit HisF